MNKKAPNNIVSLFQLKCPNCREGQMFTNKSMFPLSKMMSMPERCAHCSQKFELETGFWFGTGYISYAISVGLMIIIAVIFGLTYGFSWDDNSVFIYLAIGISILVLLQPFLMRFSRALYLRIFVRYKKGQKYISEQTILNNLYDFRRNMEGSWSACIGIDIPFQPLQIE